MQNGIQLSVVSGADGRKVLRAEGEEDRLQLLADTFEERRQVRFGHIHSYNSRLTTSTAEHDPTRRSDVRYGRIPAAYRFDAGGLEFHGCIC